MTEVTSRGSSSRTYIYQDMTMIERNVFVCDCIIIIIIIIILLRQASKFLQEHRSWQGWLSDRLASYFHCTLQTLDVGCDVQVSFCHEMVCTKHIFCQALLLGKEECAQENLADASYTKYTRRTRGFVLVKVYVIVLGTQLFRLISWPWSKIFLPR